MFPLIQLPKKLWEPSKSSSTGSIGLVSINSTSEEVMGVQQLSIVSQSTAVSINSTSEEVMGTTMLNNLTGFHLESVSINSTSEEVMGTATTTNAVRTGPVSINSTSEEVMGQQLHRGCQDSLLLVSINSTSEEGMGGIGAGSDRKSTRLNSSHSQQSRMPSSA